MNREENQLGPLVGWVICRLKEESNENQKGSSLSHHIVDLTFGSLSRGDFPPTTSWVFLAKEKHLSIVAHHFTDEEIYAASEAQIKVNRFRRKNDAHGMEFTVNDTIRGVIVSDCPIQELNGSYLEQGSHNGVPKYVHVRKWCILRMELPELPELGISAADTLRMEQNGGNTTFFYSKADDSFARIVDPNYNIREGGSEFTRLYIDIARAGNKMVIEDQTLLKLHDNQIRSTLQDKNSSQLLKMLAKFGVEKKRMENDNQINALENDESMNIQISESILNQDNNESILVEDNNRKSSTVNEIQANGTSYDDGTLLTEQILTKNITHQQKPFSDSSSEDPYSHEFVEGSNEFVYEAEAELANEVVSTIIAREEAVSNLIALAIGGNKRYLNGEVTETTCFEELCEPFQKVRDSTLAYFQSFAVWQRVRKRRKHREQYYETKTNSIAFNNVKDTRSFSVVIAYNSAVDLYGSSDAVKSTVSKKFCRNFEPAVKKKELQFVGEFATREAAINALENALQQIPQEQWLQADLEAHSKAIISFRPCKKHYLVRTSGVDSNIPCELCAAAKATRKVATIAGSDTETLAFPWRAIDYNMKLQHDLSALDQLEVFVKHRRSRTSSGQSILRLTYNPLLLDDTFLENAGRVLRSSHGRMLISELDKIDTFSNIATLKSLSGTHRPNISYSAPSGPIQASKGKIELLHDALAFSRTYQQKEKEKAKLQPYLTLPYNKSQNVREYESSIQDKKRRVKHERQRQEAESIQDDMIKLQMQLASLSIPAPSELLKRVLQTIPMAYDVAKISTKYSSASADHEGPEQTKEFSKNCESQRSTSAPVVSTLQQQQINNEVLHNTASTFLTSSRSASILHHKDSTQYLNETQTKQVIAEIVELGATMTITQERLPPAYREEDKFCRTDIGEWAGMTTGRAVRSFNFHDKLLKEGREKEKMRKQLQLQLRRAISSDKSIVNCNVAEIEDLIRAARAIRGSVLHLDIINAENYLRRRAELISWSNHMQSIFRGNKDRKLFREMRTARIEGHRKKVVLSQYAAEWSTVIALDVLQQGVKKETKRRLQDRFRCVVNLSGILAVATVARASRAFRGPLDAETICPSCASIKVPGKHSARYAAYELKRREREDDIAMAGAGRIPTAKKTSCATTSTNPVATETSSGLHHSFCSAKTNLQNVLKEQETSENMGESTGQFRNDHSEYRFPSRPICTCPVLEESERWHVRFYFPLSCAEDVREFSIEQILDTLGQLEAAFDMYRLGFQKQQLFEHKRLQSRRSNAVSARMSLSKSSNNIQTEGIAEDKTVDVESEFQTFQKMFRPLFDSQYNPTNINDKDPNFDVEDLSEAADEASWAKAYVRAGKESAAALRLMTSEPLPLSIVAILQGGQSKFPDKNLPLDDQFDRGHRILPDYHCLNISDKSKMLTANSAWQPFHRLDVARVRYNNAKHKQQLILQAQSDVASKMKKVEEELALKILIHEHESMVYEDNLAKYFRLRDDYEHECRHNAYVMAKSKEFFESVDAMEKQIKLDDLRSYDSLESGSLWKTMHRKGEIEQELMKLTPTIHESMITKAKIAKQCIQVLKKLEKCQSEVIQQDAAETNIGQEVFSCEANLRQAAQELSMASKQFVRSFSKPRRLRISYVELLRDRSNRCDESGRISTRDRSLPSDRRLQILPHNLVLVRDANLRLKQENRKLLSGLCRRILSIHPLKHQDYLFADSSIRSSRCMVSCFVDDLTGTMVIHLTDASLYQRELSGVETAEAIQHEDFQLDAKEFSPLATVTQRYEISLSNEEVKYLLSKYALESKNASMLKNETEVSAPSQSSTFGVALMTTSCVRSITHQTHPLKSTPESAIRTENKSKNNYLQRFELREKADVETAETLVSLLRLQPFTNRPCLGGLAFHRRLKHILFIIQQCAWYRDLLSSQPSSVATTQTSKPMFTSFVHFGRQQRLLCKIWQHLDKFELHFVQLECNLSLHRITRIELNALQILQRLRYSTVDTCAWIGMMTLNRYDISSVFDCLISALIPSLPGIIHWRSNLATEIPVISFEKLTLRQSSRLSERTFHRVTSCHRFVSGKFCMAVCAVSGELRASGLHSQNWSLSISLHPPIEDKFANHRYCETEPLVVTMSYQELVAFLLQQVQVLVKLHSQTILLGAQQSSTSTNAKKQKRKLLAAVINQVMNAVQNCFSLLHPNYFDKLLNHLLDCMDFAACTVTTKNKNEENNKLLVIPVGALRLLPGDFTDMFLKDHRIEYNLNEDLKDDIMNQAFSFESNEDEAYSRALHCGLEIDPIALSAFMKRSVDQHIEFIQTRFPSRAKELGLDILKGMTKELTENVSFEDLTTESTKCAKTQGVEVPKKKYNNEKLERRKVVDAAALLNVVSWSAGSMTALTTPVKREKDLIHALLTIEQANITLMRESIFVTEKNRRKSVALFEVPQTTTSIPIGDATADEAQTSTNTGQQLLLHSTLWKFPHHANLALKVDESCPYNLHGDDSENSILTRVTIRSTPTLGAVWIDVENALQTEMEPEIAKREMLKMQYEDIRSERLRSYYEPSIVDNNMSQIHDAKSDSCNTLVSGLLQGNIWLDAALRANIRRQNDHRLETIAAYILKLFRLFRLDSLKFLSTEEQSLDSEASENTSDLMVHIVPLTVTSSESCVTPLSRKMFIPVSHMQHHYNESNSKMSSVVIPSLAYRDHTIWQRSSLGLFSRNIVLREERNIHLDQNNIITNDMLDFMNMTNKSAFGLITWRWQQDVHTITHIYYRSLCIRHVEVILTHDCSNNDIADSKSFLCSIHLKMIDLSSEETWTIVLTVPIQSSSVPARQDWFNSSLESLVLNQLKEELFLKCSSKLLHSKVCWALKHILDPPLEAQSISLPISSNLVETENGVCANVMSSQLSFAKCEATARDTDNNSNRVIFADGSSPISVSHDSAIDGFSSLVVQPTLRVKSSTDEIGNKNDSNVLVEFDLNTLLKCHRQYFWGPQRSTQQKSQILFCPPQCESSISHRLEMIENDVSIMEAISPKNRKNIRRSAVVASPQKAINTKKEEVMTEDEQRQKEKQTLQELSDLEDSYDVPWQPSYLLPGKKHFAKKCKLVVVLLPRDLTNEHCVKFIHSQVMQKKVCKFLCQLNQSKSQIINYDDWERDKLTGLIVYSHKNVESISDTQDTSKLTAIARRLLLRQQRRINERFISIMSLIPNALQELQPARIEQLARRPGILLVQRNLRSVKDREQLLSALKNSLTALAVTQENRRRSAGRERECLLQHQRLLRAVSRKLGDLLHDAVQVVYDSTHHLPCRLNAKHIDSRRYRLAVQLLQTCEESLMAHRAKRVDKNLEHRLTNVRSKNIEIQDVLDLEDLFRRVIDLDFHLSHISQDRKMLPDNKEIIAPLLLEYPGEDTVDDILEPFSVANLAETELADSEETRTSAELFQILDTEDCLYLIETILTKETNSDLSDEVVDREKSASSAHNIIDSKRLSTKELSWLRLFLHPLHVLSAIISIHCCGSYSSDTFSRSPCELPLAQCNFPGCRSCRVCNRIRKKEVPQSNEIFIHSERFREFDYRHWQEQFIQPWLISIVDACATTHEMKIHWTSGLLPPSMKLDLHDITHSKEPALTIKREKMLEEVAKRHFLRELDHKRYLRREYRDTLLTTQCFIALRYVLSDVCLLPIINVDQYKRSKILTAMTLKDNGRTSAATQWLSISSLRTLGGRFGLRILNNLRLFLLFLYQISQYGSDCDANESCVQSLWKDLRKAFSLIFPPKRHKIQLDAVEGIFGIDAKVSSILHNSVVAQMKESVEAKMRKSQTILRSSISQRQHGMEANEYCSNHFEFPRSLNEEKSDAVNLSFRNDENTSLKILCDSERLPVEHIQAILTTDERNLGKNKRTFSESVVYSNPGFCFLLLPLLRLSPKDLKQRTVSGGSEEGSINQTEMSVNCDIGSEEQMDLYFTKCKETTMENIGDIDLGRRCKILYSPSLSESLLTPPMIHGDGEKGASVWSERHSQFQSKFPRNREMDCFVSMDRLLYEGSFFYSNFEKSAGLGPISEIVMIAQFCFGRLPKNMADVSTEMDDPPVVLSQVERDEINEVAFHIGGKIVSDNELLSGRLQMGSERFVSLTDSLLLLDGLTVTIYDTHSQVHSKPIGIDGTCLQRFLVQHNQEGLRTNINGEILSFDSYRNAAELLFKNLPQILQCTFIHGRCISMSINLDTIDDFGSSFFAESAVSNGPPLFNKHCSNMEVKKRIGNNFAVNMPNRSLNVARKIFNSFHK